MGTGSQNYIKEKDLNGHPNPIAADKLEDILELIKKCIYDIKCPKGGHGTGFFFKIPYPDFITIKPVLITTNRVLEEDELMVGKKIHITLNKDTIKKEIIITDKRKVYTNKDFDITIIELYLHKIQ